MVRGERVELPDWIDIGPSPVGKSRLLKVGLAPAVVFVNNQIWFSKVAQHGEGSVQVRDRDVIATIRVEIAKRDFDRS